MQARGKENDRSMLTVTYQWFRKPNLINSFNFNATTLKLPEKFDHPFSHLLIFNIFAYGHSFDAVPVKSSKYFVYLP